MAIRDIFNSATTVTLTSHTPDISDTGSGWVVGAGTWQVNSGDYLEATVMASTPGSLAVIDVGNADYTVGVDFKVNSNTSEGISLVLRYESSTRFLYIFYIPSTGAISIRRYFDGAFFTYSSSTTATTAIGESGRIEASANGSSVRAFFNDTNPTSTTATSFQTATKVGVRESGTVGAREFSNFVSMSIVDDYDVFTVIGQSNAQGIGARDGAIDTFPWNALMLHQNGDIVPASHPMRHISFIHGTMGFAGAFCQDYASSSLESGRNMLFVCGAEGGTGFGDNQWNSGDSQYEAALTRTTAALALGGTNTLKAILWHQGEHDAVVTAHANNYATAFTTFLSDVRTDYAISDLPIICGGLVPDFVSIETDHATVNTAIETVSDATAYTEFVDTTDLSDDGDPDDDLHFNAASLRIMGSRYYTAYAVLVPSTGVLPIIHHYNSLRS